MVKRFTLLMLSVLLVSGLAMALPTNAPLKTVKQQAGKNATIAQKFQSQLKNHVPNSVSTRTEDMSGDDLITSVEGTQVVYNASVEGSMYDEDYSFDELPTIIVYGENGGVYFNNIFPAVDFGTYVKGTLEDDVITVELPQVVAFYDDYGYGYYVTLLKQSPGVGFIPVEGNVTYEVYDDGDIVLILPDDADALGLCYTDDDTYAGLCDFSQVFTPFTEYEITQMPENVTTETFYLINGLYGCPVEVGYDDSHLYIQGMVYGLSPNTVVIGDLNGNTATIPQDEFLGISSGYMIFTKAATIEDIIEEEFSEGAVVTLDIDQTNKIISYASDSPYLIFNAGIEEWLIVDFCETINIKTQDSLAGIPENPLYLDFADNLDSYGYYSFYFTIPNLSTDGTVIDPGYMYYRVYTDGELYEFVPDYEDLGDGYYYFYYFGLDGPTTEIPFLLDNGNDFYFWGPVDREVGIYDDDFTTIGVQTVYRYNGKVTQSDIVTLNLLTGEETTTPAGIESIVGADVTNVVYYDLNGRKVLNPANGVFVKKSTLSNGKTVTTKVIKK